MIYNEEIKNKFLNSLPTDTLNRMYKSIFQRTEGVESKLGKDIASFEMDECMNLIIALNPKSTGHIGSLLSQLNKYGDWAVKNGVSAKNYWSLVPVDEDYAKQSFSSRNVKDIDELMKMVEAGLSVPYDKYIIYLLYIGAMGEDFSELINVYEADVDTEQGVIKTSRRTYTNVPDPIMRSIASNDYYEERKQRDYDSPFFIKPYKTKHLLGSPISYQHVHKVVQKLNVNYNKENPDNKIELTPTTIWRSGLFNSLYQIEKTKGDLVADDYSYVSEIYGNKNTFSSYLRDYDLYKEIFWS